MLIMTRALNQIKVNLFFIVNSYIITIPNFYFHSWPIPVSFYFHFWYVTVESWSKTDRVFRQIEPSKDLALHARTMDAQWSLLLSKSQTFGLGQTILADKFRGIWGIFGRLINTCFVTSSPLFMFSINQPLFLQKTKPLYLHSK